MSRLNILLTQADRGLGMIVKAYLDSKGYPTALFNNGKDAWNSLRDVQYDLCITDIEMPEMNGFELLKKIKSVHPMMPVLMLTAKNEQDDILETFDLGAEDYITKPFSMDELLARVKVWDRWMNYSPSNGAACEFHLQHSPFHPHRPQGQRAAPHLEGDGAPLYALRTHGRDSRAQQCPEDRLG